ncbi:MAG: hypothetical protein WCP39_06050, partial [Chlamydiota bacterium]
MLTITSLLTACYLATNVHLSDSHPSEKNLDQKVQIHIKKLSQLQAMEIEAKAVNVSHQKLLLGYFDELFSLFYNDKISEEKIMQQLIALCKTYPKSHPFYKKIERQIKEIKDFKIRKKILTEITHRSVQAFITDIDGTLFINSTPFAAGEEFAIDYADSMEYISTLLSSGIKFVIVSCAQKERIYRQIIHPLKKHLGSKVALLSNFFVYCNSLTEAFTFDIHGREKSMEYPVQPMPIPSIVVLLKKMAQEAFGLTAEERKAWIAYYGDIAHIPWAEKNSLNQYLDATLISPIGLGDIGDLPPFPYIYTRDKNQVLLRSFPPSIVSAFF